MKDKKSFSPPMVGGVTLLVVFAALCLTIFALLSLSTIQADSRLADASINAVSDYYTADLKAQEIIARLRSNTEIPSGDTLDGVHADGDIYSYSIAVSQRRKLEVSVRINGSDYTILNYRTVPSGEWTIDNSLHVWDGVTEQN